MPLTEVDPNIIRHDSISRSSNVSGKTSHKDGSQQAPSTHSDRSAHPAGVLSMLKTTTETGDIGAFSMRQNRLHQIPNASSSRRQAGADPSRTSSHYSRTGSIRSKGSAQSKASNRSTHDQLAPESWPYNYHPQAISLDLARGNTGLAASNGNLQPVAISIDKHDPDHRAFSLTKTLPPNRTLSKHRSAASLRSQPSTFARPHSPYMYPTRLRRPGFRPDSPALSDNNGLASSRMAARRPAHGIHTFKIPPVPQNRSDKPQPHPALSRIGQHGLHNMTMENHCSDSHQPASWRQNSDSVDSQFWQKIGTASPFETSQRSHNGQLQPQPGVSSPSPLGIENSRLSPDSPNRMREEQNGPYVGFVQRVRQALEERVSMEELRRKPKWDSPKRSIPEEKESDLAETHASPVVKRLTRDMIKAAIGPPSDPGVASSPEGAGYRRTDESTAEDSSAGAGPSLELSRTTPDPPIDVQTSALPQADFKGSEEAGELKITLTAPSTPPEKFGVEVFPETELARSSLAPESRPDANVASFAIRSQGKREALDESPYLSPTAHSPELDAKSENKHTSLPEAKTSKVDSLVENHVSMPGLSTLTNLRAFKLAPGSSKGEFPTWNSGNDAIVNAKPATAPSSAQSSFDTLRTSTGDIDVPTWATSSVKVRIRAKSHHGNNSGHDHRISDAESHDSVAFPEVTTLPARIVVSADNSMPADVTPASNSAGSNDRFSAMKQFHFPLPDLAEDSQEDASTTNLRMLGSRRPDFRKGGMKQPRRDTKGLLQPPAATESPASYVSRKLAHTRNMPSLNFSQMDLTTKLNLALNIRSSHSTETLRSRPEQETRHSGTEQLSSSALMRERYKSFFSDGDMVGEVEDTTTELPSKRASTAQKHLSNEELMTEIERLSIPSVNGLTVRLSELLPTIKSGNSDADATSGEDTHDNTKGFTGERSLPERMESVERKKIAVVSSLTAGRIAKSRRSANGAHSPLHRQRGESPPLERLMKDLPPLPKEEQGSSEEDNMLSDDDSRNLPAELEATVPLGDTNTRIDKLDSRIDTRDNESTNYPNHQSKDKPIARSMAGTPDSRPWNKESNYPWEDQSPAIEISPALPERENGRSLMRDNSERNSRPKPPTGLSRNTTERIVRSMSPGPHVDNFLVPQSQLEDELEQSGYSRSGIIGSIQRKIGMKSRIDKAGFPVDAIFLHPEERFTEPGDRYPTSGLTPPSHVNMDEARSYFSDDSSEHRRERVGTLRKRLTKMRQRQPGARQSAQWRSVSPPGSRRRNHIRSMVGANTRDSNSEQSNITVSNPNVVAVYDQPPAGMSKLEYRAKRLVEKLRIFWCRSGKVIRSMSRANRHPHIFYEPDLYEGV